MRDTRMSTVGSLPSPNPASLLFLAWLMTIRRCWIDVRPFLVRLPLFSIENKQFSIETNNRAQTFRRFGAFRSNVREALPLQIADASIERTKKHPSNV